MKRVLSLAVSVVLLAFSACQQSGGPLKVDSVDPPQGTTAGGDEITIVGSRCGRMTPALDLLKSGAVNVEDLIDEEMPLSKGVAAFARAAEPGVLKILISMAN